MFILQKQKVYFLKIQILYKFSSCLSKARFIAGILYKWNELNKNSTCHVSCFSMNAVVYLVNKVVSQVTWEKMLVVV